MCLRIRLTVSSIHLLRTPRTALWWTGWQLRMIKIASLTRKYTNLSVVEGSPRRCRPREMRVCPRVIAWTSKQYSPSPSQIQTHQFYNNEEYHSHKFLLRHSRGTEVASQCTCKVDLRISLANYKEVHHSLISRLNVETLVRYVIWHHLVYKASVSQGCKVKAPLESWASKNKSSCTPPRNW